MSILYSALLYLIQPIILLYLWLHGCKIPSYRKRIAERYGYCIGKVQPNGIIIHSVSVGETLAIIPLVRTLRHRHPTLSITVTTMTPTGSEQALQSFGKDVHHVYLPYDLPNAINRFLNTIQPKLMIITERELWPNLIRILYKREIPLVIANARLSERSAQRYKKLGTFMNKVLRHITFIATQSEEDKKRFLKLGVKPSHITIIGNLKFDINITKKIAEKAVNMRKKWAPFRPVWIASSTHAGEETIILKTHRCLLKNFPNLLLILVPRHPERFKNVEELTKKQNFKFVLRNSGKNPSEKTEVVIGNTMGELMLLYGIADLAFVGGSLSKSGGHNPLEAAAYGIPILMGPYTWNFKDICTKLQKEKGLITVTDVSSLENKISNLLKNPNYRLDYGFHAMKVLHSNQGVLDNLLKLLEPYLPCRKFSNVKTSTTFSTNNS